MTSTHKKPGPPRVAANADARSRREATRERDRETPRGPPDPASVEKLRGLIKGIEMAMLTVLDEDGSMRSIPMYTQKTEFDGSLYFLTGKRTRKAGQIEHDDHVCLSYADPKTSKYLSVTGRARLLDDRSRIAELWSPLYHAWWPAGKDDPDIVVLEVQVDRAEYWDTPGSTVVQVIGLARAVLTGKPWEGGQHEEMKMH